MINFLDSLKSLIKQKSYHIDFALFRLHYQATVCLLLSFCLILTAKVIFGDTIYCYSHNFKEVKFANNVCYSQGTYTDYSFDSEELNYLQLNNSALLEQPIRLFNRFLRTTGITINPNQKYYYSGIALASQSEEVASTRLWHWYYQYVPLVFFIQAVFFYFPHYLWKMWENGIITCVCKQLHENRFTANEYIQSNHHIVDYLRNCFKTHKLLVYKYYICHLLLWINLIAQIFILNIIFNNQFITYGHDVFQYIFFDRLLYGFKGISETDDEIINDPMNFVFPKVTKCTFELQSVAGNSVDTHQFVCALPLNILHDKFFFVVWCWFVVLALLTICQIASDVLYLTVPAFRKLLFNIKYGKYGWKSSSLTELFMLSLIGSNSDKFAFSALMKKLNKEDTYMDRNGLSDIQSIV